MNNSCFLLPTAGAIRCADWRAGHAGVYPPSDGFSELRAAVSGQRTESFVIVSDALRYEAAAEFAQRLQIREPLDSGDGSLFGSLPSYTQLGMASLLPGKNVEVDRRQQRMGSVDGRSATGTANRNEISSGSDVTRRRASRPSSFSN